MTLPRYSIIPGGASTNPDLEGNDLRVLCFLGEHTNKLGWCFLSQGKIAEALHIGRATVQRSLGRLSAAGYVEIRASAVSGRPHACHAYRVIMDRDDPAIEPSESEVEEQIQEGGCPPAGTPGAHAERAGVPAIDGHGVPTYGGHGVPIHARAHNDQDSVLDDDDAESRAREAKPIISEDAHRIAAELAKISGHDPQFLPPRWVSDGPAWQVQQFLDAGWSEPMMLENARAMIAAKRDGPPYSIRYFAKGFAAAHARQSAPQQLPNVHPNARKEASADDRKQATDWQRSRDKWRRTADEFRAGVDAYIGHPETGGESGERSGGPAAAAGFPGPEKGDGGNRGDPRELSSARDRGGAAGDCETDRSADAQDRHRSL